MGYKKMVRFNCYGHENIKATHKNTLEFTKEKKLTPQGDCILGVDSDFDLDEIREFIMGKEKATVKITVDGISDRFEFIPNPKFNDDKEMVFRLGEFASERTLGLRASKACKHIKREIAGKMKEPGKKMEVIIE